MRRHRRAIVVAALVLGSRVHLREALARLGHALTRILEREILPWYVVRAEAEHVLDALGAGSTRQSLRGEHGIILIALALERHEQVIQILQVLLQQLVCLVIFDAVSKPIH